jgi:hypothetical protein
MRPEILIGQELQRIGDEFNNLFIHGVSVTPALRLTDGRILKRDPYILMICSFSGENNELNNHFQGIGSFSSNIPKGGCVCQPLS